MKKVRMMLSLLAIVFAVVSAIASVNVVRLDVPERYASGSSCETCTQLDDPNDCGEFVEGFIRCECSIPNPEGGVIVLPAENAMCQELWKQPAQ